MGEERAFFESLDDEDGLAWIQENEQLIRQLCSCVANGDPEAMEALIGHGDSYSYGNFASTPLRHVKNLVIILTHNLKTAAIHGGAGHVFCSGLEETFIRRIENCESVKAVQALADTIKRSFCWHVYEQKQPKVSDPIIQRAVQYMNDHCTKKIGLSDLADALQLSRGYLSRKFHSETGVPVSVYIQRVKIHHAKAMLEQTDASLAEIASLLAFSSQSYFQNVFRKTEGCTPASYRRAQRRDIR